MLTNQHFFSIIFFYIIRHFLTKKLKIFRPHFYPAIFDLGLQNITAFDKKFLSKAVLFCQNLSKKNVEP